MWLIYCWRDFFQNFVWLVGQSDDISPHDWQMYFPMLYQAAKVLRPARGWIVWRRLNPPVKDQRLKMQAKTISFFALASSSGFMFSVENLCVFIIVVSWSGDCSGGARCSHWWRAVSKVLVLFVKRLWFDSLRWGSFCPSVDWCSGSMFWQQVYRNLLIFCLTIIWASDDIQARRLWETTSARDMWSITWHLRFCILPLSCSENSWLRPPFDLFPYNLSIHFVVSRDRWLVCFSAFSSSHGLKNVITATS